jgi:Methyltransferase domain.
VLAVAKSRLGDFVNAVHWLEVDVTKVDLLSDSFDIWYDRAVFHFFTEVRDREVYLAVVHRSVKFGGFALVVIFADDGLFQCSGLSIVRYSFDALCAEFGDQFTLVKHEREEYRTLSGGVQHFLYCAFQRK